MKNISLLAATIALAAFTVTAQDWAKAKLEKSPRHPEWVNVKHGDREVNSFVVYPEVKDKATAVIVIHEIFGLSDWARCAADEFAEAGYIAIAPDLLSGSATGGGGTAELIKSTRIACWRTLARNKHSRLPRADRSGELGVNRKGSHRPARQWCF